MRNIVIAAILGISAIICFFILNDAVKHRNQADDSINVTGLGEKDFESDLIVWSGSFSRQNMNLSTAYEELKADQEKIRAYLTSKGLTAEEIIFSSVELMKEYDYSYRDGGREHREFLGYRLNQRVDVESKKVVEVEKISREVTELINLGIEFNSFPPQYYYTRLAELKHEMIAAATRDATARAEKIAENAGSDLGELKKAQMGVFQIIAQNSNEEYSWGGAFNTHSKAKTATITMRLEFRID